MMSKFLVKQKIAKFDPYITKLTEAECLRISLKNCADISTDIES